MRDYPNWRHISVPADYAAINLYQGTRSPSGTVIQSQAGMYFWRSLYHRLTSTINFQLPEGWDENYFRNVLFGWGYIGVIRTAEYGIVPQFCTLTGYGIYMQPVRILVTSPLIRFEGQIGEDCELIRLTPDYIGVCDIVDHYADQLANLYGALDMSVENSKIATLFFPRNQAAAQSIKDIVERISAGEARIFTDKLLKEDLTDANDSIFTYSTRAKENYLVTDILADMQAIVSEFDREVGIPVVPAKKERYNEMEISSVLSGSAARLSLWSQCLSETMDNVMEVFPELDIKFTTVMDQAKEVGTDVNDTQTDSVGDVSVYGG